MGGDRAFIGNKEFCDDETSKTIIFKDKVCLGRQGQEKFGDELFLFSIIASVLVLVLIGMLLAKLQVSSR
jgi:hypothetical protein